jgi:1,4-dihydroxy-2-naphthoyl-CoA hydrolase
VSQVDLAASPFDDLIGTEWGEVGPERATATLVVEDRHKQPYGPVHGGVLCTLAEAVTSRATSQTVRSDGKMALGQSNHVSFLRPIMGGAIHVEAHPRHRGRTSWVWDVEISDDEGRLCALSRVIVAIRPLRRDPPGPG